MGGGRLVQMLVGETEDCWRWRWMAGRLVGMLVSETEYCWIC